MSKEIEGLKFFMQEGKPTCLPCSLNTILHWLGENWTIQELIKKFPVSALFGTDFLEVLDFLKRNSYNALPFVSQAKKIIPLLNEGIPVMAWIKKKNAGHVCVIYGYAPHDSGDEDIAIVHDPAEGKRKMNITDFDRLGTISDFGGYCCYLIVIPSHGSSAKSTLYLPLTEDDPFYHNMMGEWYYFKDQKFEKSFEFWNKSLKLKGNYSEVYNNLAIYYSEQKKEYQSALGFAQEALRISPDEVTYALTIAEIYNRMQEKKELFSWIQEMEKRFTKNLMVLKFKRRMEHEYGRIDRIV